MTLPYPIPAEKPYPSSVGFGTGFTQGWAVWAIQRAINRFHASWNDVAPEDTPKTPLLVDENFHWDKNCEEAIKAIQSLLRLEVDGVAGMATQRRIVKYFCGDVGWLEPSMVYRAKYGQLPFGLLASISYGEMVYWIGGVSWNDETNIDIGAFQDNLRGVELQNLTRVQHAFDIRYQVQRKASELIDWYVTNHSHLGCSPTTRPKAEWPERTWRRAAMAHNRPLDAAVLARFPIDKLDSAESRAFERSWVGLESWDPNPWNEPLSWVLARQCVVPNTSHKVQTRLDWTRFYALGFPTMGWGGLVCRGVKSWAPQVV